MTQTTGTFIHYNILYIYLYNSNKQYGFQHACSIIDAKIWTTSSDIEINIDKLTNKSIA
jgi:hypothetical protein